MRHSKPRYSNSMLQLRRSTLYCRSTVSGKRPRTIQASTRRMLRLTLRRHDSQHCLWHNNHTCRLRLISASKRIHRQLLALHLAVHNNHLRSPNSHWRTLQTTEIQRNSPSMKARLARLTGPFVVPFGKQNSKPKQEPD